MTRFEALVVDFGGVLTTPLQDSFVAFCETNGIELQDLVRVALKAYSDESDPLVVAFETGRLGEDEFSIEFAQRLAQETGVEIDPERLVGRLFGAMRLEEGMVDAVRAAKSAGYRTALLSNSWGMSGYPRELLASLMDVIVISGDVGLRKPDPAIFQFTTAKLGIAPESCVFVDDHPGHLKVAQGIGMTTVLHRSPAETIAELEKLLDTKLTGGRAATGSS